MTVFADPRSGIFDPAFGICQDRDQMPAWGNKAMTMLRPILPRFMGLVMGVHLIGESAIKNVRARIKFSTDL